MRQVPIALAGAFVLLVACSDDPVPSAEDPLGCGLPRPCGVAEFTQASKRALSPDAAGTCMLDALKGNGPVHLTVQFRDLTVVTWDFYRAGADPPVVVESECEFKGPCREKSIKRCILKAPEALDCSRGQGAPRVCGDPVHDWCSSTRSVEAPVCP
jgi:hypothetical protein